MRRNQSSDLFNDIVAREPLHIHRVDFFNEFIPRTRANIPHSRLNLSEFAFVKELKSEILLDVGRRNNDDLLGNPHLFHIIAHFLRHANRRAGLPRAESVIQQ